jgi:hypothetical protein
MYPNAYLIKVDKASGYFEVIDIPRWMSKRDRERFNNMWKTQFSDYMFAIGYSAEEIVAKILGVPM